ncbi:MAG: hypothetical protein HDR95_03890 [Bacteroides sp.]|nr:hypothetical protein [Bacteroides sp.]
MIPASYYHPIYFVAVILLTIVLSIRYQTISDERLLYSYKATSLWAWIVPMAFALFIGFRPVSGQYFVDMANYDVAYYTLTYGKQYDWDWHSTNYIFDNVFNWLGEKEYDISVFFVGSAIIYFIGTYVGIRKIFPNNALYAYVCFLGAFSTFSYGTNGMKAGLAATLFIIAVAYYSKPIIGILFLFLSLGFHHSMILPIVAVAISFFYRNSKAYLLVWIVAFIIALLHITYFQEIFGGMADDKGSNYLLDTTEDWGGKTGFRLDFVIYSILPIVTGFYWVVRNNIKDAGFSILYNTYVLTNAVWMLCMYANFTNRIAYLSWFLYPIVLIYPLLKINLLDKQSIILNYTVWGQLIITLMLAFIL